MVVIGSPVKATIETPAPFSQIPGTPSFRNAAINCVALIPLMSSSPSSLEESASAKSLQLLMQSLERYAASQVSTSKKIPVNIEDDLLEDVEVNDQGEADINEVLLVVPNAQLTRPGDWRYEKTPLQNFHWNHGCQRIMCFDGRPQKSRHAHDRLMNHTVTREWIDLCPSRRTAAVVGILNLKDIENSEDGLKTAEAELQQWAERYSTPPFEVTAHGRSFARDGVVQRLFVFESFQDGVGVDLTSTRLGSNLVAFPPSDNQHTHMMDLHLNVVVNDLAVAIFRQLEIKIRESDTMAKEKSGWRAFQTSLSPSVQGSRGSITGKSLGKTGGKANPLSNIAQSAARAMRRNTASAPPQLLTPMDHVWDLTEVSPKDADAMRRRDVGRREKLAADLSLLAGSPMDAYERYSKAAELAKASPDPLWYASALEGCAAAHLSMAEAGGYNVDAYLENHFQLPDEFMAVAHNPSSEIKKSANPKQTLPAVIYALCEESLNIYNRHESLANFHAELLLKLAWYTGFVEEGHLRCRWGEGKGCYGGDPGEPRRWDKTAVANLTFANLNTKDGEDLVALSTLQRAQKFCEYMHRAVSTGGLDPLTRADVAATCARMSLIGIQSTKWKHYDGYTLTLPRKAAFFTTVAGEAMSKHTSQESLDYQGSALWLAATQLYSKKRNTYAEGTNSYGWASLRATVFHALSKQEDSISGEAAAELLLVLLSQISPDEPGNPQALENLKEEDVVASVRSPVEDDLESMTSMGSRYSNVSKFTKATTVTSRSSGGFFGSSNASSLLTVAQAKWAEDTPLPNKQLPLIEELSEYSLSNSLVALKAMLHKINATNSAIAQKRIILSLSELRQGMATVTNIDERVNPLSSYYSGDIAPLDIVSTGIVKSPSHLLLERTKAHGYSGKATGVMATFFNPFEKQKKQAEKKIAATLVAEGEEREVLIEFNNRLSVPLEVPSCQLEFDHNDDGLIKAPALSFIVPAKAKRFKVHFPFIVRVREDRESGDGTGESEVVTPLFEVVTLRVFCLSRSFLIPIQQPPIDTKNDADEDDTDDFLVPRSGSIYARSKHNRPKKKVEEVKPRFEAVPAQPNLHVSFTTSQTPIEDGTTVPVHLSDGEIFTIPTFRLQNDFGPSGLGKMERLQILGVGMPGLPDEVLFDTDAVAAAREEEEEDLDSESDEEESEDFEELMEEDGLPPLKMKALCEGLSLEKINNKKLGEGSKVTFHIAATHDMGNQLANGGNVRIRFRYRGISPNPATEIWRKREVALRIVRVKGPRISSLTFRSDLSWGSSYSELCMSLAQQKLKREQVSKKWASMRQLDVESTRQLGGVRRQEEKETDDAILYRVGKDNGVHVASEDIVVLMAVANETNSTILLSNRKGRVGGFEGSPMPTIRVTSGVSVKIPVVIPRISRVNTAEGEEMDIAAELIANTALQWESVLDKVDEEEVIAPKSPKQRTSNRTSVSRRENLENKGSDAANRKVRHGRVRIPSKCLREIIAEHKSFASRICKSPVSVKVNIGRKEGDSHLTIRKGQPVDTFVEFEVCDWVPKNVIERLRVTMEFCCARKDGVPSHQRDYVWCGLMRRTIDANDPNKKHRARITFLEDGSFVVSACAKLSAVYGSNEETWWAPIAEQIQVLET